MIVQVNEVILSVTVSVVMAVMGSAIEHFWVQSLICQSADVIRHWHLGTPSLELDIRTYCWPPLHLVHQAVQVDGLLEAGLIRLQKNLAENPQAPSVYESLKKGGS